MRVDHMGFTRDEQGFPSGLLPRPRQDSNLRTRLRRPMLYPLSYEGEGTQGSGRRCRRGTWTAAGGGRRWGGAAGRTRSEAVVGGR